MKKLLLASAALMAFAAGAQAADLGSPRMPIAAAVVAPAFSWTGFYVGGDIGYWTSSSRVFTPAPNAFTASPNPNGVKLGGHIGYLHQFANQFVLGVEADLSWLGGSNREGAIAAAPPNVWRVRATWDGSIRGTVGFAVNRALIYGTGGVAFIQSNGCGSLTPGGACVADTQFGGTRTGWTLGAGIAYAVTNNISVRGEYLYADYGTRNYVTTGTLGGVTAYRLATHTVRLGLSYHFSTGPSAVVARY